MQCNKCGIVLNENAKFCSECGEKVIRELKCKQCGNKLKDNSKFCDQCGTKVEANISTETLKKLVSVDFFNLAGQSIGRCNHNQSRWVRQHENYIYICKGRGVYKIDTSGSNGKIFYESKNFIDNININKNGIVVNAFGGTCIEILNFTGELVNKINIEDGRLDCTYVYDNQIFFSINDLNGSIKLCISEFGKSNYKLINSFESNDGLSYFIANKKYVIFKSESLSGWNIMNIDGSSLQKIYINGESNNESDIDILYFDVDNGYMFTSAFYSEKEKDIRGYYIVKRKITNNIIEGVFEDVIWNQDPNMVTKHGDRFYGAPFINNEYSVGFNYGHTKDYSDREDHYYNLYAVYNGNGYKYLNCGSRSGIETLICEGEYAYWNDYDSIYQVKIDGTQVRCLDSEL